MNDKMCDQHSGICKDMENVKESVEGLWDAMGKKVGLVYLSIFVAILFAVMGAQWKFTGDGFEKIDKALQPLCTNFAVLDAQMKDVKNTLSRIEQEQRNQGP